MASPFLDTTNLTDAWDESQTYMRPLFEPFDEYERLARNQPHPGIAPHLPKVTEGTLSSTIIKQPRRIIQQIPTGKVYVKDQPDLGTVLSHVLSDEIIPNSRAGGTVLQKAWASTTKALTYGSQPAYVYFTNYGDYYGADYCLPYIRDVFLESGQLASNRNDVMFMRHWYTPNQIKAIISTEKRLMAEAKELGEDYTSSWDLKKLAKITDKVSKKPADAKNPAEAKLNVDAGGVQLVHAFQAGVDAEFYSFAPDSDNDVMRTKPNQDRRGVIPLHFQFHTVDMNSPLGRGAVEHSGAVQNMLDGMLQSFQYNQALLLSPPMKKWGDNIVSASLKMRPDAIWDMGSDRSNDVEAVNISTQAIQNFPNNFGLIKGIILTGTNGQDTSISAESGNTGFSKTNAGVKQQQAILGVDDNYIRKQYEDYQGEVFETALNLTIAENSGVKELNISEDAMEKLATLYPELQEEGAKLDLIFDRIQDPIEFHVDASTSAGDDDNEQTEILTGIIDLTQKYPNLLPRIEQEGYQFSLGETVTREIVKSGVDDPEKIIRKMSEEEIQQQQLQEQVAMEQEAMAMGGEMPMEMAQEAPEVTALRERGLDDNQIAMAMEVLNRGGTADDALNAILGGVNG